ncbi:MAG: hypothetical protein SOZ71_06045 [Clostridium sp.]|nr:hypothetical protein [Clostridium sp.]
MLFCQSDVCTILLSATSYTVNLYKDVTFDVKLALIVNSFPNILLPDNVKLEILEGLYEATDLVCSITLNIDFP